jgi:nicotinate phosphoribosyltransferase
MLKKHIGLYTDLYELSMAQGYYYSGRKNETACFDYFFRKAPFGGSYVVFAGLRELLNQLENLDFSVADCKYLSFLGFEDDFLDFLINFRFNGNIFSPEEGEPVFPNEPVIRVEGSLIETQLIESLLLNIINFESLIATKASRIKQAAKGRLIAEFGLRRAQGYGGLQASRAAIIGGADSTSNVLATKLYGTKASGTQAHSWIQSFENELQAFRAYADTYPENCFLLVDTYNTLKSGIPNSILVGKELKQKGFQLKGIRLDSGDLLQLSKEARKMLDEAGLEEVKIVASNQLDEFVIDSLIKDGAPIDIFGVGTSLSTGAPDAALDGIYKLSVSNGKPKLKLSENPDKISLPGLKEVIRLENEKGEFIGDGVCLKGESSPIFTSKVGIKTDASQAVFTYKLLKPTMRNGRSTLKKKTLDEIRSFSLGQMKKLPPGHKKLKEPLPYFIGYSDALLDLQKDLAGQLKGRRVNV